MKPFQCKKHFFFVGYCKIKIDKIKVLNVKLKNYNIRPIKSLNVEVFDTVKLKLWRILYIIF